jgi:hypothetical protein
MSVQLLVLLYLWEVRQSGHWVSLVARRMAPTKAALVVTPARYSLVFDGFPLSA